MKIWNKSKHDTHMVSAVIRHVKSKLYPGLKKRWMRGVVVRTQAGGYCGSGRASNPIRISLGQEWAFPSKADERDRKKKHDYLGWPALNDKWECLAFIAGHEMEHRLHNQQAGAFPSTQTIVREDLCDAAGYDALDLFRKDRLEVVRVSAKKAASATDRAAVAKMKKAQKNSSEVKLEAVQQKIKEWSVKAKRVSTALKKYKQKERYYLSRMAASKK